MVRHFLLIFGVALLGGAPLWSAAVSPPESTVVRETGSPPQAPYNRPPRKVLIGTVVGGNEVYSMQLEGRFKKMREIVAAIDKEAKSKYPSKGLDLVVLPEFFLGHPGDSLAQKTVRLEEVEPDVSICAKKYHCYIVAPALLRENTSNPIFSSAALLIDREGHLVGIYRKVHPVGGHGSRILEGGLTPGRELPVFACDFGRLGIQICFDMVYADGWQELADQGAEIVALPSASPETVHPSVYALQNHYYVVSAAPRDHSAVFSPLGLPEAEISKDGAVLVHEIDLSYAVLHWDADLEEGAAARKMFGDAIGFHYYRDQDMGIFWSNDPRKTIGAMLTSLGLSPADLEVERLRAVQDSLRGTGLGPPRKPH